MHPRWLTLCGTMLATGMFNAERLKPRLLATTFFAGRAVMRGSYPNAQDIPAHIDAYIGRLKTDVPHWQEVALAFVGEKLRENGVLKEITYELIARTPANVRLFLFTKDIAMMRVVEKCQFQRITRAAMPDVEAWARNVGCWDRLPDSAFLTDTPLAVAGERQLFVRG
ncbi:hypothetical protein EXS56_01490 [Candidatus Kaiserbacteria bacterium]|nr:hypothetical protein [Candidatus Kaiserbacteria bacterium]